MAGGGAATRSAIRPNCAEFLELPDELATRPGGRTRRVGSFSLFAPRGFVARMRPGDPNDPLLRQVLPLAEELDDVPGFVADPVGDAEATRQPGLLQKYDGRVLLVTTGTCAVHCRYCFRRHFPYAEAPRSLADWQPALDEIAADTSIHEVILSGGDPLMIVDHMLAQLVERAGGDSAPAATAGPHAAADRDSGTRDRRTGRPAARHAAHADRRRPREPCERTRCSQVAAALAKLSDAGIPLLESSRAACAA